MDGLKGTSHKKTTKKSLDLFYKPYNIYAITFNLEDKFQYAKYVTRIEKVIDLVTNLFKPFREFGIEYNLYMEISEPKQVYFQKIGPRIYFHGTIKFLSHKSVRNWLTTCMYRIARYGIVDIDSIDDIIYWSSYCKKQQHIIKTPPISSAYEVEKKENKKINQYINKIEHSYSQDE